MVNYTTLQRKWEVRALFIFSLLFAQILWNLQWLECKKRKISVQSSTERLPNSHFWICYEKLDPSIDTNQKKQQPKKVRIYHPYTCNSRPYIHLPLKWSHINELAKKKLCYYELLFPFAQNAVSFCNQQNIFLGRKKGGRWEGTPPTDVFCF